MQTLLTTNVALNTRLAELEANQTTLAAEQRAQAEAQVEALTQIRPTVIAEEYTDIVPIYVSGDTIQLDAFKVIPEFTDDRKVYRSWRTQVEKLMSQISSFKTHPKYATALSISRAKITGTASDIFINNNTALNIDAIIDRLDFSYADQRPLYVIEADMMNIKQQSKTLQEFYDAINQALNMVITKITMSYKEKAEQKSLINENKKKAIRTFITGVNSGIIRTTLYGNMPTSLSKAFAIAQTVQYDNQHFQLDIKIQEQQRHAQKHNEMKPNFNSNFRYQTQQVTQAPKPKFEQQQKPTPMEIDSSKQFVQQNWQAEKRQREASFQFNKPQPSFQHLNKQQRVNHVDEAAEIQSVYDAGSLENNFESETDNTEDNTRESVFLEE